MIIYLLFIVIKKQEVLNNIIIFNCYINKMCTFFKIKICYYFMSLPKKINTKQITFDHYTLINTYFKKLTKRI